MKKQEAEKLLRKEYVVWRDQQEKITPHSKFNFYWYIYNNKSYLLEFRFSGSDQWQTVNSMLSGL